MTTKQRQALNTIQTIIEAFYDEQDNKQTRTWRELQQTAGLSAGALSKHLRDLIGQGVIKKVPAHYEYTERPVNIKGKKHRKVQEVIRFYKSRQNPKDIKYQLGYLTKPKARSAKRLANPPPRFVHTGPVRQFPPNETTRNERSEEKHPKSACARY